MSRKSFLIGITGPFTYDPAKDYRNETPIADYNEALGVIAFVAETATDPPTITDTLDGFVTADMYSNMVIEVRGSGDNDGYYLVTEVEAGILTLHGDSELTAETAGAGVVTIITPTQAAYRGLDVFSGSSDQSAISDNDNDTKWETERTDDDDTLRGKTAGTDRITIDADGVTLAAGASVNEFSIDGTMAGDSDDTVPTEQAVRTFGESLEQYAYFTGGF